MQYQELAAFLVVISLCGIVAFSIASEAATTTTTITQASSTSTSTAASSTSTASTSSTTAPTTTVNAPALSFVSATASNSTATQNQMEQLSISVMSGTPPYTYSFLVSNAGTGNVVFSAQLSNSLPANSIAFSLPVEANDVGTLTFTANVADSAGANVLGTNTIEVNAIQQQTTTSSSTSSSTTSLNTSSSTSTATSSLSTTTIPILQNYAAVYNAAEGKSNFKGAVAGKARIITSNSVLRGLSISFNSSNLSINLTISNSSQLPAGFSKPENQAYQFIQINGSVGAGKDNIDLYVSNATYNFTVPKSWVQQEGINALQVRLVKYDPSTATWGSLSTTLTTQSPNTYFYTSTSNSLSTYAVTWVTGNSISTTSPLTLPLTSGFNSYFYVGAIHMSSTNHFATVNFLTQNMVSLSGGSGGGKHTDNVIIGSNILLSTASLTASASAVDLALAGIGANVVAPANTLASIAGTGMGVGLTGNAFFLGETKVASGTTETLSFNTLTANSFVILLSGDNATFGTITLPTGCQMQDKISESTFASVYAANCIIATATTGATFKVATASHEASIALGAYVFPEYSVLLKDSPGTGNVLTASCNGCPAISQVNGNIINVVGDGTVNAVIPSGSTFSSWSVDTVNSANVIIDSPTTANTQISVMGNAIITATYTTTVFLITSATSSNDPANQGQAEKLTINLNSFGTSPYTYNFLVTNTNAGNIIFSAIISNALTTNSVAFILPTKSQNANDIGTLTFTANAVDNTAKSALLTNTITVNPQPVTITSAISSNSPAAQGQAELLTINAAGGTVPYSYNYLVTNSNSGNIIFSTIVSNSLAANSVGFTLPTEANVVGTLTFSANVVDSESTPTNYLLTNTIPILTPTVNLTVNAPAFNFRNSISFYITVNEKNGIGPFNVELYNVTGLSQQAINVIIPAPGESNSISFNAGTAVGAFTYNAVVTDIGASGLPQANSSKVTIALANSNVLIEKPSWNMSSPIGYSEPAQGYDQYTANGLTFNLYGYNFTATVANGVNTLQVFVQKGTTPPANLLNGQNLNLNWTVTPIGGVRWGHIEWKGNTIDTGNTLLTVLQGGLLNYYYGNVPSTGTVNLISSGPAPTSIGSGIYTLGGIRIKIVTGTVAFSNANMVISPSSKTIQVDIYNNTAFDQNAIDIFGATKTAVPDVVEEYTGFTKEKSMLINIPQISYNNQYVAVDPTSANAVGSGLLYDTSFTNSTLFHYNSSTTNLQYDWGMHVDRRAGLAAGTTRDIQNMQYTFGNNIFESHTFDMYVSDGGSTEELEQIGRIVQPYTVSYFPVSNTILWYFPKTVDDAAAGTVPNALTIYSTTVAMQSEGPNGNVLVTTSNVFVNTSQSNTGEAGQSVDLGFRHFTTFNGVPSNAFVFNEITNWQVHTASAFPVGTYQYPSGDAGVLISSNTYFTNLRLWQGTWASTANVVPILQRSGTAGTIVGAMKNISSGSTPSGSDIIVDDVVIIFPDNSVGISTATANSLYNKYNFLSTVPTNSGMVDLGNTVNHAYTNAPWDVGEGGLMPVIFSTFTSPATCVPTTTNTLVTFPATQAGLFSPTANAVNVVDSGTVASNIYVYGVNWISTTSTASFMVMNTLWSATSGGNIGTQMGNIITYPSGQDTLVPVKASGGGNVIYFGLNVPAGQASETYNQLVTVALSC